MEKYIITGAMGHIGNVIVKQLVAQNMDVTCLALENEDLTPLDGLKVKVVYGDVTNRDFVFSLIQPESIVFHLAGIIDIGTISEKLVENVNLNGTINIVDACIQNNAKKLIYLSTVHIIDPLKNNVELLEPTNFDTTKLVGVYAKTKAEATKYIFDACKNKGLNATVLYPSGVIGPYDYKISEIGQVVLDYMNRKLFAYVKGGYNFVDVRDVANATILAANKGRSGEGYIISGRKVTLKEVFEIINKKLGRKRMPPKIALWFVRMFAGISNLYYKVRNKKPVFSSYSLYTLNSNCNFSNQKAKNELGFSATNIETSLGDAVDWFIKNKPDKVNFKKINK